MSLVCLTRYVAPGVMWPIMILNAPYNPKHTRSKSASDVQGWSSNTFPVLQGIITRGTKDRDTLAWLNSFTRNTAAIWRTNKVTGTRTDAPAHTQEHRKSNLRTNKVTTGHGWLVHE